MHLELFSLWPIVQTEMSSCILVVDEASCAPACVVKAGFFSTEPGADAVSLPGPK